MATNMSLKLRFSGGNDLIIAPIHHSLDDSSLGAVFAMMADSLNFEDIWNTMDIDGMCIEHAGPLLHFLKMGSYMLQEGFPESEAACYKAMCTDKLFVPGLVRDIEGVLHDRVVTGKTSIAEVRAMYSGYERIDSMCDSLDRSFTVGPRL